MTMQAAQILDRAWGLYYTVATTPDGSQISIQSPSWQPPSTPYDHAAALCKSLIPLAYNFKDKQHPGATQAIWDAMLDTLEVISIEQAVEIINNLAASR